MFDQDNVRRWMRAHGGSTVCYRELADRAAQAFGVSELLAGFEVGEHWTWQVAAEVVGDGGR